MKHFLLSVFPPWFTFGLIFIAILPFVGGSLSAGTEIYFGESPSRAKLRKKLIVIGGALSILGALVGALAQAKDSYELWAFSTGGDDYCYLLFLAKTTDAIKFSVVNNGDYPLYDVSVEVTDLNHWEQIKVQHPEVFDKPQSPPTGQSIDQIFAWQKEIKINFPVGNLRPNEQRIVWDAPIPKDEFQRYYVTMTARNGYFEEEILLRRMDDGNFTWGFRVWKGSPRIVNGKKESKFLKEELMDAFRKYYPAGAPWTEKLD
jgi:hypothetical protein